MVLMIRKDGTTKMSKNWLSKKELARALSISYSTLWRAMKSNYIKAKKLKLKQCPVHTSYSGGRKYYIAEEVSDWFDYMNQH